MEAALGEIRPERRPNAGPDAVVPESRFAAMRSYIEGELQTVPEFPAEATARGASQPRGQQLNRMALEAFLAMRDAAWADGVPLAVMYGARTAEQAAANAARAANPEAVARYSSHMLGLAMDLRMSVTAGVGGVTQNQTFSETSTASMPNVVGMYASPVHKWLMINGEAFGWFPWHHEPWHWEYNPPGLRERFHR
jgi:hypothetical protein